MGKVAVEEIRTLVEADVRGRRVLLRVDLNVPMLDGAVVDDTRIQACVPTIEALRRQGARIVLASHLGRPNGRRVPSMSLEPVARRLAQSLNAPVDFADDCVGDDVVRASNDLKDGQILLVENLRFHEGEANNDADFSDELARLGDVYVNDAFGTAHRAHASVVGVPTRLPSYAGLLMERELEALGRALASPKRPFVAILGGAKVSGKLELIESLLPRVDLLLIGGAMANTFSRAQGGRTGASFVEQDRVEDARRILTKAGQSDTRLMLPKDTVATRELKGAEPPRVFPFGELDDGWQGVDIGPTTRARFGQAVSAAKTVLFNGPMGVFEVPPFDAGTCSVLEAMAGSDAFTILGGGDSAAAASVCGVSQQMGHVSTGGGASLEFLALRPLPGLHALRNP